MDFIYGIMDKTTKCPFYVSFFKEKEQASIELKKQMDYARLEFGMGNLSLVGDEVKNEDRTIFKIVKHQLK